MKKVELILCMDDHTWQTRECEIPVAIYNKKNTDDVAAYIAENGGFNDCVQVGVYNWMEDQDS
jgi:hypothetical protein